MFRPINILGYLIVGLSVFATAAPAPCTKLSETHNQEIALSGKVDKEIHWGPPNFGETPETDSKFTVWVLKLDKGVNVSYRGANESGSPTNTLVSKVQLLYIKDGALKNLKEYNELHVQVTGTLHLSMTGGQVTPLYFKVRKIDQTSHSNSSCVEFLIN